MAKIVSELLYKLTADEKDLVKGLAKAEKESQKTSSKIGKAFASIRDVMQGPIAAVGMVAGAFKNLMGKAKEYEAGWAIQEEAIALLESTLKATGATAWTSSEAIQAMASEFQSFTKYGDETILTMQGVLLGFKNIKGDNFEEASLQILNMATVMKMDLSSAAQAVGKALDDPIEGINSLTRQGFRFTEQEKEMLKVMVESGDIAGAQKVILDELATTYGGAAIAAGETGSAISTRLNNAIGDTKELAGKAISEGLAPFRLKLLEIVTSINNNAGSTNDLEGATNKLVEASKTYNGLVKELASNTDTLTDAERQSLEVRRNMASNDIRRALDEIVSSYSANERAVESLTAKEERLKRQRNEQAEEQLNYQRMTSEEYARIQLRDRSNFTLQQRREFAAEKYAKTLADIVTAEKERDEIILKQSEGIQAIARAVNEGSINIEEYRIANGALYDQIMLVASGIAEVDEARRKADEAAALEIKADAEREAERLRQLDLRKAKEKENADLAAAALKARLDGARQIIESDKTELQLIDEKIQALQNSVGLTKEQDEERLAALAILSVRRVEIALREKEQLDAIAQGIKDREKKDSEDKNAQAQKDSDKEIAEAERVARTKVETAKYAASQIFDIARMAFDNQKARLDEQYSADKLAIEKSLMDEDEKAEAIKKLDQDVAIKKAEIAQKAARFQKAQAIMNAAMNSAQAITSALTIPPPFGAIAAGIVGALTATQVALIANQPLPPIPKFARGGSFIVPEGFGNDSYPLPMGMAQSGERVTVETKEQQRENTPSISIGTVIASPDGYRELNRQLAKYGRVQAGRNG